MIIIMLNHPINKNYYNHSWNASILSGGHTKVNEKLGSYGNTLYSLLNCSFVYIIVCVLHVILFDALNIVL